MDIPLTKLKARFMRFTMGTASKHIGRTLPDGTIQWGGWPSPVWQHVKTLAAATCVWFLCPLCFQRNGGSRGTHSIRIDFVGRATPDEHCMHNKQGQPVRWAVSGTGLADLVLSPSIQIEGGCNWHGYIGRTHPGRAERVTVFS